jgi:site-specific recombinase XerD
LHTLRHSIASHLLHSGMQLEQTQRFLGHGSMESTQIYTHLQHEQKYEFTPATLAALEPFKAYLKQEQFNPNYIHQTINYTATFYEWATGQSLVLAQIPHADVMEFADRLRQDSYSIRLINQTMRALRYYFAHLQQEANHNPAAGIILKGSVRNLIKLSETFYYRYGRNIQRFSDDYAHFCFKTLISLLPYLHSPYEITSSLHYYL